jgi:hypothetical protein
MYKVVESAAGLWWTVIQNVSKETAETVARTLRRQGKSAGAVPMHWGK